jgi:hypothetical protein
MEFDEDHRSEIEVKLELSIQLERIAQFTYDLSQIRVRIDSIRINQQNLLMFLAGLEKDQYKIIEYLEIVAREFDDRYSEESKIAFKETIDQVIENKSALQIALENGKDVRNIQKIIRYFIEKGADLTLVYSGRNLMHLAAIYESNYLIAFLSEQGIVPLDDEDSSGRSPIELAIDFKNNSSAILLACLGSDLNVQKRNRMYTPCEKAVFHNDFNLILNFIANGGRISKEVQVEALSRCLDKKVKKIIVRFKKKKQICWGIFGGGIKKSMIWRNVLCVYLVPMCFIVTLTKEWKKIYKNTPGFIFLVIYMFFYLLTMIAFVMLKRKKAKSCQNQSLLSQLYFEYKNEFVCPYCKCMMKEKTRHCFICNMCVPVNNKQDFDHHCKWLDHCIGKGNKFLFNAFIFCSMTTSIASIISNLCYFIIDKKFADD